jgi:asparagine synthase (glutamine-hydrolysing)
MLMLSKFARKKVTVALSGDGGDELFWGYPRSLTALKNIPLYRHKPYTRKAFLLARKLRNPKTTDLGRHWGEKDFTAWYYHTLFITGALRYVPRIFKEEACEDYYYASLKNNATELSNSSESYMNVARKLETDIHLQRILLKVDRASMYNSLEVRVPLLSNSVIDMSTGYTYKECIHNGTGKMILKKMLIKKTSKELVMRPKKGFVIPISEWMREDLRKDVTEKILDMPAHLSIFFNKADTEKLLTRHMTGQANLGWLIWAIYSLVNWDAHHVKNKALTA